VIVEALPVEIAVIVTDPALTLSEVAPSTV
jgi:hypothetical protein